MKKIFFTYYVLFIISVNFIILSIDPFMEIILKHNSFVRGFVYEESIQSYDNLSKGTFHLIKDKLSNVPENQWEEILNDLQSHFGYPLKIIKLDKLDVDEENLKRLKEGTITLSSIKSAFDSLYQRIGKSDYVLAMGPFEDETDFRVYFLISSLFALLLILPVMVWSFWIWRDLKKISTAANQFGEGNFDARVQSSSYSNTMFIAESFNSMASRIANLVKSHRTLSNAVSHELRTPVARVKFGLEMLRNSKTEEAKNRYIDGVDRDTDEMENLIDEMLTYARFDREPDKKDFNRHEIIPWMTNLIHIEQEDGNMHGKDLVFTVAPGFLTEVPKFDPKYMEWVVRNLIKNARLYTKNRIEVLLTSNDNMCEIMVDDNGPGIPEEKRYRIFKPFERIDTSRNKKSGGYGLGLAIVHRIIKWHEGNVTVMDSPLGGARFLVSWPAA